ncbi:MAG: Ku protein [Nocardioides sp.]
MRAIWKGSVSFGLVNVPVKLYSATESHDVTFRQVHVIDGGRIKYQRVCSIDGEEVAYADIAKGYETEDGEMVILTDDDLAELPLTASREIAVEKFVPTDQIDPMLFEKSYYLEPEKSGAKPYALLRQALLDADRMAVVTVALRQRTSVAVLRVRDDVIVMQTMMWPDEIRQPDFSVEPGEVKDAEVQMAHMLDETLAGDFDPDEIEDDNAEALHSQVQAKIEGGEVKRTPTATKSSGEVVDLLAALQRSVEAAKSARGESTEQAAEVKPAKAARRPPRRRRQRRRPADGSGGGRMRPPPSALGEQRPGYADSSCAASETGWSRRRGDPPAGPPWADRRARAPARHRRGGVAGHVPQRRVGDRRHRPQHGADGADPRQHTDPRWPVGHRRRHQHVDLAEDPVGPQRHALAGRDRPLEHRGRRPAPSRTVSRVRRSSRSGCSIDASLGPDAPEELRHEDRGRVGVARIHPPDVVPELGQLASGLQHLRAGGGCRR